MLNLVYQLSLSILFLKTSVFDGPKKSVILGSDVRKVLTSYNNVRFEKWNVFCNCVLFIIQQIY